MSDKSSSKSRKVLHEIATFKVRIVVFGDNTDYGHSMAKFLMLLFQIQIPIPNKCLGFGYKGLVVFRNNC